MSQMKKFFLLLSITIFLLHGCGLWTDFKTYFNLYYNTTDLFEQAESSIKEQKRSLFSTEELTLPGSANQQLTKVIEKCSEILQFHSSSSYVENALLIIGKSFYYQKNYQKALRKFQELIAAQPESGLILETKLWIGKTQMRLKDYENALQTLKNVREESIREGEDEFIKESFVEEIVYRKVQQNYLQAIDLANQFVEISSDNSIKAEIYYELGLLYGKVDDPENAYASLEKVFDYSPSYEIELESRLELGKTLRKLGKNLEALQNFEKMRSEAKFNDAFHRIDLETGITLIELGEYEQAVEQLTMVDTAYATTKSAGVAKYKLGEIYQYHLINFDSAGVYYQKAAITPSLDEYTIASNQKTRTFRKYHHLRSLINNTDDQLFYVLNPDEYSKDSLAFVQDSIAFARDSLRILEELNLYSEHLQQIFGLDASVIRLNIDSLKAAGSVNLDSLISYYPKFLDSLMVLDSLTLDSMGIKFSTLDSIRIADSIKTATGKFKEPVDFKTDQGTETVNIDSLFRVRMGERERIKKPVKSELTEDSLKSILVKNELELGNLFLTELNLPDSAYFYYNDIITSYPRTMYHANVLYALGSYYLTVDKKETADSLFNYIYDFYKGESIVNAAANKIGKPLIDIEYDPAKELYADAENELLMNNYSASLKKFYDVYRQYPKSPVAPKALFASGWILENELELYDSAAVVYDTMSVKYPQSEYAVKIRPKLTIYKQHKEEMKKAIEDSLRILEQQQELITEDSLLVKSDTTKVNGKHPELDKPKEEHAFDDLPKEPNGIQPKGILNDPRRNLRRK
jgi:tetratricopeptide (TPR) repeat protein